ncbi:MAG: hypothetical protein ACKOTZ_05715 [Chloroflexota bacterium]
MPPTAMVRERDLSVVLDADAISKLARRDRVVRTMLDRLLREREAVLVIPLAGVAQALAEGSGDRAIERIVGAAWETAGLDMTRARMAAQLLRDSGTTDLADALVCGEALLRVPSVLITSDPADHRRLLDHDPRGPRVAVWRI